MNEKKLGRILIVIGILLIALRVPSFIDGRQDNYDYFGVVLGLAHIGLGISRLRKVEK